MIFIIFIAIAIASYAVQASLESKFKRYSRIPVNGNLTGAQVAERMLREHGIYNVQVTQTDGHLTDHYNPMTHTVNLSREVYYGNSVASAAVAAHECGHALQHATGYSMLRSYLRGRCDTDKKRESNRLQKRRAGSASFQP